MGDGRRPVSFTRLAAQVTTVQIRSACSSAGKTQDRLLEKMAWIHAFVHEMPVSSPQGYVEDALSRASPVSYTHLTLPTKA